MIIPIRCFTCSKVIADKYEKYVEMVEEKKLLPGMQSVFSNFSRSHCRQEDPGACHGRINQSICKQG